MRKCHSLCLSICNHIWAMCPTFTFIRIILTICPSLNVSIWAFHSTVVLGKSNLSTYQQVNGIGHHSLPLYWENGVGCCCNLSHHGFNKLMSVREYLTLMKPTNWFKWNYEASYRDTPLHALMWVYEVGEGHDFNMRWAGSLLQSGNAGTEVFLKWLCNLHITHSQSQRPDQIWTLMCYSAVVFGVLSQP